MSNTRTQVRQSEQQPLSEHAEVRPPTGASPATKIGRSKTLSHMEAFESVQSVKLFADLNPKKQKRLMDALQHDYREYEPGQLIVQYGQRGDTFFIVAEGQVDVDVGGNGSVEESKSVGEFFGERALELGENYDRTVRAVTHVECFTVDHDTFVELTKKNMDAFSGHKGVVKADQIDDLLKEIDQDGDGQFSTEEVREVLINMINLKESAKVYKYVAMFSFIALMVVCCAMLGITLLGNEMSKDFRPTPGSGVLEDEDGNTLGVRTVEQQDGFAAAFDWKPQQLDRVKSLYFPEDPTVTCATDVCACRVHNPSRIEYLSAYCVRNPTTRGVIFSSQRHAITTRLVVLEH